MSSLDPQNTSLGDLCSEILKESGYLGVGQTALSQDINDTWSRVQWMLQEWERKRWLVYHLVNLYKVSTGAMSYTIGPGGDIDTGVGSVRPARIESAFLRQLTQPWSGAPIGEFIIGESAIGPGGDNPSPYLGQNFIDYPLEILQSREDYDKIALKSLMSFPGTIFLDSAWPLGNIFCYPVPQAAIYSIHVSIMAQLPASFANLAAKIVLPYEYYAAILYNGALRMRARYQIGTFPGDVLPEMAKSSLKTLRGANTQIARLELPNLNRSFLYNIFSDRFY